MNDDEQDDFERRYIEDVRMRIVAGEAPPKPLIETRAELLHLREAAAARRRAAN